MRRIAVVGGGIAGLAAAYDLERLTDAEIDLYEASDRLGGKLRTDAQDGFLIESGPDCFFSRKPGVLELVRELGIEGELVAPRANEFGMVVDGALHLVPRGLVALAAPDPAAIRDSTFLSDAAKARALTSRPVETEGDLSIRAFFSARYGPEFSRLVAEPLLAGTHGGDPDRLSMGALYPAYLSEARVARVQADDRAAVTRGSLPDTGFGRTSHRPAPVPPPTSTFLSFRNGMQTLVDALTQGLQRTRVHLNAPLVALPEADRVLVAVPANRAAAMLPGVGLETILHRSSAIVTLAFRRVDMTHPLGGTGFLVPPDEPFPASGATWSSEKWPGRAPDGVVLMRVFLRRDPSPLPAEQDGGAEAVRQLLGISGKPLYKRLDRWTEALPQYEIGHLDRLDAIEANLPENVWLAGTSYRGVGVPDALRQGRDAARRISETL